MKQSFKLPIITAVAIVLSAANNVVASAINYDDKKSINDNWSNGSEQTVWKNGTDELCWENSYWTQSTANSKCGAIAPVVAVKAHEPALETPAPVYKPEIAAPVAPRVISKHVTFSADALFDFDKSILKPAGKQKLEDLGLDIKDVRPDSMIARGHTDSVGSNEYNRKLSLRRAHAVKDYLSHMGIDSHLIKIEGHGETLPVASNKTSAGRALNRRVEIEVVGEKTIKESQE